MLQCGSAEHPGTEERGTSSALGGKEMQCYWWVSSPPNALAARNSPEVEPQHHPHHAVASGWEIEHLRRELPKTVHFSVLTAFSSVKYRCKYLCQGIKES